MWVTGHSLGGALAMLFALRLKLRRGLTVAGVYTFGQPRVGNLPFSLAYDKALRTCTYRVVHADDLVPRVPWLLGAFRHCGTEVFYSAFSLEPSAFPIDPPWWAKAPADIFGAWREWRRQGRGALLNDHHISRYLALFSGVAQASGLSVLASRQNTFSTSHSPVFGPEAQTDRRDAGSTASIP